MNICARERVISVAELSGLSLRSMEIYTVHNINFKFIHRQHNLCAIMLDVLYLLQLTDWVLGQQHQSQDKTFFNTSKRRFCRRFHWLGIKGNLKKNSNRQSKVDSQTELPSTFSWLENWKKKPLSIFHWYFFSNNFFIFISTIFSYHIFDSFFIDTDARSCLTCDKVLAELEKIDDDTDSFGVDFVKINDKRLAKQYGIKNFPALTYFRWINIRKHKHSSRVNALN